MKKINFVEKNSMFLVRHIEPTNLVRLAWITRKFLKTENIFLNLEHSHTQKSDKLFFSIFKNFLLLHANLTKLIGSLCWTLNVTFFSTKHFSLACGRNKDFSYLRTLHVLSQDSRFTFFNKLKCLFFCHFFIVHWIITKVIGLVYLFSKIIMIFFKYFFHNFCGRLDQIRLRKTDFLNPNYLLPLYLNHVLRGLARYGHHIVATALKKV